MELPKKRRCPFCTKHFRPDPRQGSRQRVCSGEDCQRKRRAKTQASWRARNPDYPASSQLKKRSAQAAAAKAGQRDQATGEPICLPDPLPVPQALEMIPWSLAQEEIGVRAADFLALVATCLANRKKTREVPKILCSSALTGQERAPP
jgi:hypothetical protein